ncbi:MAG: hypothetical protein HY901_09640 [Deltaproteobacteria bacterium]|nr:hypothetical protein [Deltaproteobacteria bacterium]
MLAPVPLATVKRDGGSNPEVPHLLRLAKGRFHSVLAAVLLCTGAARAAPGDSGGPRQVFQCLGVGTRTTFTFRIYKVSFCLEEQTAREVPAWAREAHPSKEGDDLADALSDDDAFFERLMRAPGDKLVRLDFVRDVDRARLEKAIRGGLEKYLASEDIARIATGLRSVHEGDVVTMRSLGNRFVMQLGPHQEVLNDATAINQQVWTLWLGRESATPNLKESIARIVAREAEAREASPLGTPR